MKTFKLKTADVKFHWICTLRSSFCWDYTKFQLKRTKELCLITLKSDAAFEKKQFVVSKTARIW